MSYHPSDSIPDREECPRCHGLGYTLVAGEPNAANPCGCRDGEPETVERVTHDGYAILTEQHANLKSGVHMNTNWSAHIDGQEEFGSGFGATEDEAITEIRERWEDYCEDLKRQGRYWTDQECRP